MHGFVDSAIYREIRSPVRELRRLVLVDIDSQARLLSGMHLAILKVIGVREDLVCLSRMPHVFLDAEIVHAQIKMQRGSHTDGTEVRGSVRPGAHMIKLRQSRNLFQMADSTGM